MCGEQSLLLSKRTSNLFCLLWRSVRRYVRELYGGNLFDGGFSKARKGGEIEGHVLVLSHTPFCGAESVPVQPLSWCYCVSSQSLEDVRFINVPLKLLFSSFCISCLLVLLFFKFNTSENLKIMKSSAYAMK